MRRFSRFCVRLFSYIFLLAFLLQLTAVTPATAQTEDPNPPPVDTAPPKMEYQPPKDADEMRDFAPPDAEVITVNTTVSEKIDSPFDSSKNTLLIFGDEQVGVVVEENTLSDSVKIEFTEEEIDKSVSDLLAGESKEPIFDPQTLFKFQVEIVSQTTDKAIAQFDKPVRLVVDMRQYALDLETMGGTFFLSYQDPDNPGEWLETPVQQYGNTGLISVDITHFSEWEAGWRPDMWTLQWSPPAPDEFTGAATYHYPLNIPPGRAGLAPSLALSYSSSALRGLGNRGATFGSIATGWSLSDIAITRVGTRLEDDGSGYIYPSKFRLTLNGKGGRLINANTTVNGAALYYVEDQPQLRAYKYSGYWEVVDGSGTHYRLGYTADSTTTHQIKGPSSEDTTYSDPKTIVWHVDTITDLFGNQINYTYTNHQRTTETNPLYLRVRTQNKDLTTVEYNFTARVNINPTNPVIPSTVQRLTDSSTESTKIEFIYDGENLLQLIKVHHAGEEIRRYLIDATTISINNNVQSGGMGGSACAALDSDGSWGGQTLTRVMNSLTEQGYDKQNNQWVSLPATNFEHVTKRHLNWQSTSCLLYKYMSAVNNGYGGRVEFSYQSDGRGIWVNPSGGYANGHLQSAEQYVVNQVIQDDGIQPPVTINYSYQNRCYDQRYSTCKQPETEESVEYGVIAGHGVVQVTVEDSSGQDLREVTTSYSTDLDDLGRPEQIDVMDGNSTLLTRTNHSYTVSTFSSSNVRFTFMNETITEQFSGSTSISSKVTYAYNTDYQKVYEDGLSEPVVTQLGQLTHIEEYDDASASIPYRTTRRWYRANAKNGHWVIRQISEGLYETNSWSMIQSTWNYYDNLADHGGELTQGALTRVRHHLPGEITCGDVPGGDGSGNGYVCDTAFLTSEQNIAYDAYGNVISQTSYSEYGYQTQDTLNTPGSPEKDFTLRAVAPTGTPRITYIDFDADYNLYPVKVTNALGKIIRFSVYGFKNSWGNPVPVPGFQTQAGLLKRVVALNGSETTYEYDPFGRLYQVYEDGDEQDLNDTDKFDGDPAMRYRYWDNSWNNTGQIWGNPASNQPFGISVHTRPNVYTSSSEYVMKHMTYYDGFGRPIQQQEYSVSVEGQTNPRTIVTTIAYNALGQESCVTVPYDISDAQAIWPNNNFQTASCANKTNTSSTYDALGRIRFVTAPDGSFTQTRYSINTNEGPLLLHHNTINANEQRFRLSYNARGELYMAQEYTGNCGEYWGYSCAGGGTTWSPYGENVYTNDLSGNLTSVTDEAGNETTITYDNFGRKVSMDDPDMGDWGYEYDAVGNLVRQEDANGNVLCFYYDDLDRLERQVEDSSPSDACPENPPAGGSDHIASYAYFTSGNGTGQIESISWGPNSTQNIDTFTYDSRGRMTHQERMIDGRSYTMETLSFDALNRPKQVQYPNGEIVTITYDHEGENTLTAGSDTLVTDVRYNAMGQLEYIDRVHDWNLDTNFNYYGASGNFRLEEIINGSSTDNRPDFTYQYDDVGNITSMVTATNGNGTDTQTFTYDSLNRLETAVATGGVADYNHTYNYDAIGNIDAIVRDGTAFTYGYDTNQVHAVDSVTFPGGSDAFGYDSNGNMTSRVDQGGVYSQLFDVENRLTVVNKDGSGVTTFYYDASGQRIKTIEPDGTIIYTPFPGYEEAISSEGYHWTFDEGSGTTASDSSFNQYDGTRQGPLWTTGYYGQALDFDGSNDYVDFDGSIDILGGLTVSAWVRPETAPTGLGRLVVSTYKWNSDSTKLRGWALGDAYGDIDHLRFRVYDDNGNVGLAEYNGFFNQYLNQWVHITGVFRPGEAVEIYINGQLMASDTTDVPSQIGQSNLFKIGSRADNTTQGFWDGQIDEVRVIPRALDASEISGLMATSLPTTNGGTVLASGGNIAGTGKVATNEDTGEPASLFVYVLLGSALFIIPVGATQLLRVPKHRVWLRLAWRQHRILVAKAISLASLVGLLVNSVFLAPMVQASPAVAPLSGPVQSPWVSADIGGVGVTGSADETSGTFTIDGAGADIAGTVDAFHFVYQSLSGDGSITANAVSLSGGGSTPRAGIMMRDSLADNAAHVTTVVQGNRVRVLDRASTGGSTTDVAGYSQGAPEWLRIERSGNTFTLSHSNDGTNWSVMQTRTITMGTTIYVGMAVTGNSTTTLATGVFDNVSVTGGGGGATATPTATSTATPTATVPGPTPTATSTATAMPSPTPSPTPPPAQAEVIVQRTTYSIAGRAVFLRKRTLEDGVQVSNFLFAMHTDHLGSTSTLSYLNPDNGTAYQLQEARALYEPFGDYRVEPTGDYTDRGYTGHRGNNSGSNDIGLIYMNARYYVPNTNRMVSPDTIVPDPNNPQSFNRYSYVNNNPLVFTDPTGHCMQYQENGDDEAFQVCHDAWIQLRDYIDPLTPDDGLARLYGEFLVPLYQSGTTDRIVELLDIYGVEYEAPPTKISQNIGPSLEDIVFPDAIIFPGISGSATGPMAIVGGAELVGNLDSEEIDIFTYMGQGSGLGLEADAAAYGGLVWNLDQNIDYEGVFHTLTVELSFIEGAQASFFWEDGSVPFTGETWGISVGYIILGGGASGAYTQTDFDQRLKLK